RLTDGIRAMTDIPAVDYVFNALAATLPDMGGVASTLDKRQRHRRALVKMLSDQMETPNLVLCLDPSALSLIAAFAADRAETRIRFVDSPFGDDYLRGHMIRVGLVSVGAPSGVVDRLLPVVRGDLEHEAERLRDMEFARFEVISPERTTEHN